MDTEHCSPREPSPEKRRRAQVQPLCSDWNTEPGTFPAKETLIYCKSCYGCEMGNRPASLHLSFNVRQLFLISVAPKSVPLGPLEEEMQMCS